MVLDRSLLNGHLAPVERSLRKERSVGPLETGSPDLKNETPTRSGSQHGIFVEPGNVGRRVAVKQT
jgi:hypothetical protein